MYGANEDIEEKLNNNNIWEFNRIIKPFLKSKFIEICIHYVFMDCNPRENISQNCLISSAIFNENNYIH